jgi:hypothetical protein
MAEVKATYVKLGEKANFFYDPITRLKVLPKQVIKIDMNLVKKDGKIANALKGGHLEYADASEYKAPVDSEDVDDNEEDDVAMTHEELVEAAKEGGSDLSKSKLRKLTEEELQEIIEEQS